MAGRTGLFVARDGLGNGTTPVGARLALGGLLAGNGASPLDVREGVLADAGGAIVSGVGDMSYDVRAFRAVSIASAANGPTIGANDASVNVATTASPGSNSRIDTIWARQHLVTGDGATDTDVEYEIGVTQGAVAASPSAPAIPAGAIALAHATVTAGAVSTAGLTFTRAHAWTVANGGVVPIFSSTERDAIDPYEGLAIWYSPDKQMQIWNGSAWAGIGGRANPIWKATLTTSPSIPSGGDHLVDDWIESATHSHPGTGTFSYSAGVVTVQKDGLYSIAIRVKWESSATGLRIINFLIDGSNWISHRSPTTASGALTQSFEEKVYLTAGQTIELEVSQNSGSAISLEGAATDGDCSFSVEYLGAPAV